MSKYRKVTMDKPLNYKADVVFNYKVNTKNDNNVIIDSKLFKDTKEPLRHEIIENFQTVVNSDPKFLNYLADNILTNINLWDPYCESEVLYDQIVLHLEIPINNPKIREEIENQQYIDKLIDQFNDVLSKVPNHTRDQFLKTIKKLYNL